MLELVRHEKPDNGTYLNLTSSERRPFKREQLGANLVGPILKWHKRGLSLHVAHALWQPGPERGGSFRAICAETGLCRKVFDCMIRAAADLTKVPASRRCQPGMPVDCQGGGDGKAAAS
jgi:hypothetical protein